MRADTLCTVAAAVVPKGRGVVGAFTRALGNAFRLVV
jgi:hypothetical protein